MDRSPFRAHAAMRRRLLAAATASSAAAPRVLPMRAAGDPGRLGIITARFAEAVAADDLRVSVSAVREQPALRPVVDVEDAEALAVARGPFEVVHEGTRRSSPSGRPGDDRL